MADKEITLKFTANTEDAKKGIAQVTDELDKMSKAGSTKAADELDKVTESAEKAVKMTDELARKYEEWGASVKKAESNSRLINAIQFKTAENRDEILAKHQEELDKLLQLGTELAASMREIGIEPRQLESFVTYADILTRANKEFEIALNNKERLLSQPKVPVAPPVGDDPDDPEGNEFKRKYAAYAADITEYQKQLEITTAATDRFKEALRDEYSALDENAEGYLQKKQLLERLILQSERYTAAQGTLTQGVKTQIATFEELYAQTSKSQNWQKGIDELEKLAPTVERNAQKVRIMMQNSVGLQNSYNNAIIKGQNAEIKGFQKVQAAMEVAGKTREELIKLVEQYSKEMSAAQSKEEYEAAAAGLAATRKQLTLVTREASLTGAAMIGSQRSVQGLVTAIGQLGTQGRLTLKGLTDGVKMFAKSTLVLAGIQFVWEALSNIYEKVKGDLFGVADAEEDAARKAEELATAAKEAADNLNDARFALMAAAADKKREDAAREFAELISTQNDEYREQIKLVDETLAANLRLNAATAKGEEREVAYEKLLLQEQLMQGKISEYDYQKRMIDLEAKTAEIRRNAEEKSKNDEKESAFQKYKIAEEKRKEADETALEELGISPEELLMKVYQILKDEADIRKQEDKYEKRENLTDNINKIKDKLKSGTLFQGAEAALRADLKAAEEELANLNKELLEVNGLINRKAQMLTEIPEAIKDALLSENKDLLAFSMQEYTKNYREGEKYNASVIKQRKDASDESKRAEEAYDKANEAWLASAQANAEAATWDEKINTQRKSIISLKEENDKANEKHEKKKQKIKEQVQHLEYNTLKKRVSQAKAEASLIDKNTPEGKRAREISGLYKAELDRREKRGADAGQRVVQDYLDKGIAGRVAQNINDAGDIAREAATLNKVVDLEAALKTMKAALATSSKKDNGAAIEMYKVIQGLMSEAQKSSREADKLKAAYARLARKITSLEQ